MVSPQANFPLARELAAHDEAAREGDAVDEASRLQAQALSDPRRRGSALTALTLVRSARTYAEVQAWEHAGQALEQAWGLSLEPGQTRDLVARELSRHLLEHGDDLARAERLAQSACEPEDELRTAGEAADAWVLVARARHALGGAGAEEARFQAERCQPLDRRSLEALGR